MRKECQDQEQQGGYKQVTVQILLDTCRNDNGMGHMRTVVNEMIRLTGKCVIMLIVMEMETMRFAGSIDIQMSMDERRKGLQDCKPDCDHPK